MLILNFSHPLTQAQHAQIEALAGTSIEEVRTIPVQIDQTASLERTNRRHRRCCRPHLRCMANRTITRQSTWLRARRLCPPGRITRTYRSFPIFDSPAPQSWSRHHLRGHGTA